MSLVIEIKKNYFKSLFIFNNNNLTNQSEKPLLVSMGSKDVTILLVNFPNRLYLKICVVRPQKRRTRVKKFIKRAQILD